MAKGPKSVWHIKYPAEELKERMEELGTLEKVGESYGISRERVRQLLIMHGIPNDKFRRRKKAYRNKYKDTAKTIITTLLKKGVTYTECCDHLGISPSTCSQIYEKFPLGTAAEEIVKHNNEIVRENLRTIRMLRRMTQLEVAERGAFVQETVCMCETQARSRTRDILERLAYALDVPIEFIVEPLTYERVMYCMGIKEPRKRYINRPSPKKSVKKRHI